MFLVEMNVNKENGNIKKFWVNRIKRDIWIVKYRKEF